jgi:hypothetical protein
VVVAGAAVDQVHVAVIADEQGVVTGAGPGIDDASTNAGLVDVRPADREVVIAVTGVDEDGSPVLHDGHCVVAGFAARVDRIGRTPYADRIVAFAPAHGGAALSDVPEAVVAGTPVEHDGCRVDGADGGLVPVAVDAGIDAQGVVAGSSVLLHAARRGGGAQLIVSIPAVQHNRLAGARDSGGVVPTAGVHRHGNRADLTGARPASSRYANRHPVGSVAGRDHHRLD